LTHLKYVILQNALKVLPAKLIDLIKSIPYLKNKGLKGENTFAVS